ncbi:hypothetical protein CK203_099348 [Vitis vinifera]|uniref:Integrase catalytic domain-containing protein n=1 Tax=Vitis vinifera TaxID=29760 RepID=A0A438DEZ0_VITVI|nr:hypothetical protein CK203_099348 [Vitis vinifera]
MELTALTLRSAAQKAPPLFLSPPGDRADRSTTPQHSAQTRFNRKNAANIPEGLTNTRNQMKKNGGLCELMELHDHQEPKSGFSYNPQPGSIWSKPSGWDSLPPTMKQNMRPYIRIRPCIGSIHLQTPVYSDSQLVQFTEWTVRKIRQSENGRADALAGIAASLPIKEAILLPIHVQTNPSVAGSSTCQLPLKQPKQTTKSGRTILEDDLWHIEPIRKDIIGNNETRCDSLCQEVVISVKVGPLPTAPAQKKFLLVATDYFSKWVEAEAYASIKDKDVTNIAFRNFCSELNIRNSYSTPHYPQSNGQAEATNKTLITALKKRLETSKGKWVEELPGVL